MSDNEKTAHFGQRLAALRRSVKLDKSEFAEKIGLVGAPVITFFEGGGALPSCEVLARIGKVFGVDIHELLTGEPSPTVRIEVEALRKVKAEFRGLLLDVRGKLEQLKNIDRAIVAVDKKMAKFIKDQEPKKAKGSKENVQSE